MADFFTYQRKRRDLGKPCNFVETEIKVHTKSRMSNNPHDQYLLRNPNHIDFDNIAEYSEHQVLPPHSASLGQHRARLHWRQSYVPQGRRSTTQQLSFSGPRVSTLLSSRIKTSTVGASRRTRRLQLQSKSFPRKSRKRSKKIIKSICLKNTSSTRKVSIRLRISRPKLSCCSSNFISKLF